MNSLPTNFYRESAVTLAPKLLGKILCRRIGGKVIRARITETEAYYGEDDTACHASKGRTPRTDVMYAEGGRAYVYLCYGVHEMLNVVTGREGFPEAVLIRGIENFNGPGKLTKAFSIDRTLNKENLATSRRLWIEDDGAALPLCSASKRIGIAYAQPRDRNRLWRFTIRFS